jgi:hypothetical protein
MNAPLLIILLVALTSQLAAAQESRPEYGIRFERAEPRSILRGDAVRSSKIPINRTYSELTQREKNVVRSWYVDIPEADEPPFPSRGLKPILESISKGQQKLLVTGELFLIAVVGTNGKVTEVKAIGSPSPEMTTYAASVLMLTDFKPGLCRGQPCSMEFPLFQLFRVE